MFIIISVKFRNFSGLMKTIKTPKFMPKDTWLSYKGVAWGCEKVSPMKA